MAIFKRIRKSGVRYQVKVRGSDGNWITETFNTMADAEKREQQLKGTLRYGMLTAKIPPTVTVAEYFAVWNEETASSGVSKGWRSAQIQMFRDYVEPVIGKAKLQEVTPALIARVLGQVAKLGRSPQVQRHVYVVMQKVFGDAVTLFLILDRSPVLKTLKPKLPTKEADYLEPPEITRLLAAIKGKPYEVAVWLGAVAGRRVGEVQALRWDHVDLDRGLIHIRSTYVRREKRFKDYPKGRRWHTIRVPQELLELLRQERARSQSEYVASSCRGGFLSYHTYQKALRRYCKEAGVKRITSHGLRHSSSELYMSHGASRDDLRILFGHSCSSVTDRYVHDKGQRLEHVASVIRLFPSPQTVPQNVPQEGGKQA